MPRSSLPATTDDDDRLAALRQLASRLGIDIQDVRLFDRALTHASISAEPGGPGYNYESLEFLGDAVLGLAMACYLFDHLPDRTPGEYSRLRAMVVSRRCLAKVARELRLGEVVRLGRGEEQSGGRERASILADCLEALIGALYRDRGWEAARAFVLEAFAGELASLAQTQTVWDYKSRLQQYCQAERLELPRFDVVRTEGPDHRKQFEVEVVIRGARAGRGIGSTKKEAEQNAAKAALEHEGKVPKQWST